MAAARVRHFEAPYGAQVPSQSGGIKAMDVEVEPLCAKKAA
jgi:hypothetical protein